METNNKNVFAENLKKYMIATGRTRRDISDALGISYFTVSDWVNGKKYPRMDKVELLAQYFGILKSDLIEAKEEATSPKPPIDDITERERALMQKFMAAPESTREMLLQMVETALNTLQ